MKILGLGIYKIESINGSVYVGMTAKSFRERWSGHVKDLRLNKHKNRGLQFAYNKYGLEGLTFNVIEEMESSSSIEEILIAEQGWWDYFNDLGVNLYNARPSGKGSVIHSDETKKLIGKSARNNALSKGLKVKTQISCLYCGNKFQASPKRKFCDKRCGALYRGKFKIGSISKNDLIQAVLDGGNSTEIAKRLNIGKSSLYTLLDQNNLSIKSIRE